MATERTYSYYDTSRQWSRELLAMFIVGFVAATLLWVGVWYLQARPAHADAIQAQQTERQQAQSQLQQCTAERDQLRQASEQRERRVRELDQQLKGAWAAYARVSPPAK
ncbi:MAG TPA: hypothetical protein VLB32_06490 [Candidatus Acidoferrales bacterium]|nr:hypothetical protein [Candidatus Acidoferrales bacterium]